MRNLDRWLGVVLVVTGITIAGAARGYTVGFMVDPLGPRALPYLVAGLFALSGVGILKASRDTQGDDEPPGSASTLRSQAFTVTVLLLLASLIPYLGFIPPTVLSTAALAKLFGGRWAPGVVVGLMLSLGLYALFALGFGMDLPMGAVFGGVR